MSVMRKLLLLSLKLPLAAARGALTAAVEVVLDALAGDPEPAPPPSPTRPRPAPEPPAPPEPPVELLDEEPTRAEVGRRRVEQREAEGGGPGGVGASVHVDEPWDGYDRMTAPQVLDRLVGADEATLAVVRLYESAKRNRATVLRATET
jgi:hypothetical protein